MKLQNRLVNRMHIATSKKNILLDRIHIIECRNWVLFDINPNILYVICNMFYDFAVFRNVIQHNGQIYHTMY